MIDAILYAWRDAIQGGGFGYDFATCELTSEGRPPARMGDVFVGVHQGAWRSVMDNALDEYFGVNLTLTMRVVVPLDRVGDQLLAKKIAAAPGPNGSPSFNARANALASFLHMDWGVMQDQNNWLLTLLPGTQTIYGFSEPARFRGMDEPRIVGGEWFDAGEQGEGSDAMGLVATLRFEDCRRGPQAIAAYS